MNNVQLLERIALGEDSAVEFKDERVHPDDLAAALVSFANAGGGVVIVGVSNDGSVGGVNDADKTSLLIDNVCRNNVEPSLFHVSVVKHRVADKTVLEVSVPRGPQRPYRTNKGVYFVRGIAGRRIATREELLELYQSAQALLPDEMEVEETSGGDLDNSYIFRCRPEFEGLGGEELERALSGIKAMSRSGRCTLGGLLCFGRNPQKARPYARITAIHHRGTEVSEDFLDRREIAGKLEDQFMGAQTFLKANLANPDRVLAGDDPALPPPFPLQALDETVVNALLHRDYYANAQIRLFMFDDRIEVISPGRLLNSVTVDAMKYGYHLVRNPVIFSHFARLRLATDSGRGIPNMFRLMRKAGFPDPDLTVLNAEFRVTFSLVRSAH